MNPINPPSIFAEAELADVAFQINSAIELGERAAKSGAERFFEAGSLLIRVKERLKHGDFTTWVEKQVKRPIQTVRRWMRLAKSSTLDDLEERWKVLCGKHDDEDSLQDVAIDDDEAVPLDDDAPPNKKPAKPVIATPQPPQLCIRCAKDQAQGKKIRKKCPRCKQLRKQASKPQAKEPKMNEPEAPEELPSLYEKLSKAAERVKEEFEQALKTRQMVEKERTEADALLARLFKLAEHLNGLPIRKPFNKKCDKCGVPLTIAVSENDSWVPLESAPGNWELENGALAREITTYDGEYRRHTPNRCSGIKPGEF